MKLEIDLEFEALIPALTEEETADLTASLKRDGCRDAIVVWKGFVVDGHNRYRICTESKIAFKTVELKIGERANVIEWMILNQLSRRNLTAYARSMLAIKLEESYKDRAKQNQIASGGDRKSQNANENRFLTESAEPIEARRLAAKKIKVSPGSVAKVKAIEDRASEDLKTALRTGGETIASAYKKLTGKEPVTTGDKAVDRARVRVPELVRNLKLQLGNLGLGGRFDEPLDQIVEAAR